MQVEDTELGVQKDTEEPAEISNETGEVSRVYATKGHCKCLGSLSLFARIYTFHLVISSI